MIEPTKYIYINKEKYAYHYRYGFTVRTIDDCFDEQGKLLGYIPRNTVVYIPRVIDTIYNKTFLLAEYNNKYYHINPDKVEWVKIGRILNEQN